MVLGEIDAEDEGGREESQLTERMAVSILDVLQLANGQMPSSSSAIEHQTE